VNCPEMVVVPAGRFMMGSPQSDKDRLSNESPLHEVTLAKYFAIGKYEVTFNEWYACVSHGGCKQRPENWFARGKHPIVNVSWDDAQQYVAWITKLTGKPYRLPSEAEWEYAARGGSPHIYYWGNDIGVGNANCSGCGGPWNGEQTAPVGSFKPNSFGLYDTHGNVYEWVEDCWHETYANAPSDGREWEQSCADHRRVVRGGSFSYDPEFVRAAARDGGPNHLRQPDVGFRLARTLDP
jgi:formylglycine-generating enzyme required for sulfatase activity